MKPAARSAVGPSTLPSTTAPRRGAGGGGGSFVEHVLNGFFADDTGWDNGGSAITIGGGEAQWFEDGLLNGTLDPAALNGQVAELNVLTDNPNGASWTIILVNGNGDSPISQVIYSDVPTTNINVQGITITNERNVIRFVVNAGGGNPNITMTGVSLTAPAP